MLKKEIGKGTLSLYLDCVKINVEKKIKKINK